MFEGLQLYSKPVCKEYSSERTNLHLVATHIETRDQKVPGTNPVIVIHTVVIVISAYIYLFIQYVCFLCIPNAIHL